MNQELKDFFSGMSKKLGINLFCGLGIAFFTILLTDLKDLSQVKQTGINPFASLVNHNPPLFWICFAVGFLWSNVLIKDIRPITFRKYFFLAPIILIWILAIFLLSSKPIS